MPPRTRPLSAAVRQNTGSKALVDSQEYFGTGSYRPISRRPSSGQSPSDPALRLYSSPPPHAPQPVLKPPNGTTIPSLPLGEHMMQVSSGGLVLPLERCYDPSLAKRRLRERETDSGGGPKAMLGPVGRIVSARRPRPQAANLSYTEQSTVLEAASEPAVPGTLQLSPDRYVRDGRSSPIRGGREFSREALSVTNSFYAAEGLTPSGLIGNQSAMDTSIRVTAVGSLPSRPSSRPSSRGPVESYQDRLRTRSALLRTPKSSEADKFIRQRVDSMRGTSSKPDFALDQAQIQGCKLYEQNSKIALESIRPSTSLSHYTRGLNKKYTLANKPRSASEVETKPSEDTRKTITSMSDWVLKTRADSGASQSGRRSTQSRKKTVSAHRGRSATVIEGAPPELTEMAPDPVGTALPTLAQQSEAIISVMDVISIFRCIKERSDIERIIRQDELASIPLPQEPVEARLLGNHRAPAASLAAYTQAQKYDVCKALRRYFQSAGVKEAAAHTTSHELLLFAETYYASLRAQYEEQLKAAPDLVANSLLQSEFIYLTYDTPPVRQLLLQQYMQGLGVQTDMTLTVEQVYSSPDAWQNPYELLVCNYGQTNPRCFFTLSCNGICQQETDGENQTTVLLSLRDWLWERELYLKLRENRFFASFRLLKYIRLWHHGIITAARNKATALLVRQSLMASPDFLGPVQQIYGYCYQMATNAQFLPFRKYCFELIATYLSRKGIRGAPAVTLQNQYTNRPATITLTRFVGEVRTRISAVQACLEAYLTSITDLLLAVGRQVHQQMQRRVIQRNTVAHKKQLTKIERTIARGLPQMHDVPEDSDDGKKNKEKQDSASGQSLLNVSRIRSLVKLADCFIVQCLLTILLNATEDLTNLLFGLEYIPPRVQEPVQQSLYEYTQQDLDILQEQTGRRLVVNPEKVQRYMQRDLDKQKQSQDMLSRLESEARDHRQRKQDDYQYVLALMTLYKGDLSTIAAGSVDAFEHFDSIRLGRFNKDTDQEDGKPGPDSLFMGEFKPILPPTSPRSTLDEIYDQPDYRKSTLGRALRNTDAKKEAEAAHKLSLIELQLTRNEDIDHAFQQISWLVPGLEVALTTSILTDVPLFTLPGRMPPAPLFTVHLTLGPEGLAMYPTKDDFTTLIGNILSDCATCAHRLVRPPAISKVRALLSENVIQETLTCASLKEILGEYEDYLQGIKRLKGFLELGCSKVQEYALGFQPTLRQVSTGLGTHRDHKHLQLVRHLKPAITYTHLDSVELSEHEEEGPGAREMDLELEATDLTETSSYDSHLLGSIAARMDYAALVQYAFPLEHLHSEFYVTEDQDLGGWSAYYAGLRNLNNNSLPLLGMTGTPLQVSYFERITEINPYSIRLRIDTLEQLVESLVRIQAKRVILCFHVDSGPLASALLPPTLTLLQFVRLSIPKAIILIGQNVISKIDFYTAELRQVPDHDVSTLAFRDAPLSELNFLDNPEITAQKVDKGKLLDTRDTLKHYEAARAEQRVYAHLFRKCTALLQLAEMKRVIGDAGLAEHNADFFESFFAFRDGPNCRAVMKDYERRLMSFDVLLESFAEKRLRLYSVFRFDLIVLYFQLQYFCYTLLRGILSPENVSLGVNFETGEGASDGPLAKDDPQSVGRIETTSQLFYYLLNQTNVQRASIFDTLITTGSAVCRKNADLFTDFATRCSQLEADNCHFYQCATLFDSTEFFMDEQDAASYYYESVYPGNLVGSGTDLPETIQLSSIIEPSLVLQALIRLCDVRHRFWGYMHALNVIIQREFTKPLCLMDFETVEAELQQLQALFQQCTATFQQIYDEASFTGGCMEASDVDRKNRILLHREQMRNRYDEERDDADDIKLNSQLAEVLKTLGVDLKPSSNGTSKYMPGEINRTVLKYVKLIYADVLQDRAIMDQLLNNNEYVMPSSGTLMRTVDYLAAGLEAGRQNEVLGYHGEQLVDDSEFQVESDHNQESSESFFDKSSVVADPQIVVSASLVQELEKFDPDTMLVGYQQTDRIAPVLDTLAHHHGIDDVKYRVQEPTIREAVQYYFRPPPLLALALQLIEQLLDQLPSIRLISTVAFQPRHFRILARTILPSPNLLLETKLLTSKLLELSVEYKDTPLSEILDRDQRSVFRTLFGPSNDGLTELLMFSANIIGSNSTAGRGHSQTPATSFDPDVSSDEENADVQTIRAKANGNYSLSTATIGTHINAVIARLTAQLATRRARIVSSEAYMMADGFQGVRSEVDVADKKATIATLTNYVSLTRKPSIYSTRFIYNTPYRTFESDQERIAYTRRQAERLAEIHYGGLFIELDRFTTTVSRLVFRGLLDDTVRTHFRNFIQAVELEYMLLSGLANQKQRFDRLTLGVIPYVTPSSTDGSFLLPQLHALTDTDTIVNAVNDTKIELLTLKTQFTRLGDNPATRELHSLMERCIVAIDAMNIWTAYQQRFLNVLRFFLPTSSIAQQMPEDVRSFTKLMKLYSNLMTSVAKDAQLRLWATRDMILTILGWQEELDVVYANVVRCMDAKRSTFLRFHFLSDNELLMVLSAQDETSLGRPFNPHLLSALLGNCFDNMGSLVLDVRTEHEARVLYIRGITSADGETLMLGHGDKELRIRGSPDVWLASLETRMISTMQTLVAHAIRRHVRELRENIQLVADQSAAFSAQNSPNSNPVILRRQQLFPKTESSMFEPTPSSLRRAIFADTQGDQLVKTKSDLRITFVPEVFYSFVSAYPIQVVNVVRQTVTWAFINHPSELYTPDPSTTNLLATQISALNNSVDASFASETAYTKLQVIMALIDYQEQVMEYLIRLNRSLILPTDESIVPSQPVTAQQHLTGERPGSATERRASGLQKSSLAHPPRDTTKTVSPRLSAAAIKLLLTSELHIKDILEQKRSQVTQDEEQESSLLCYVFNPIEERLFVTLDNVERTIAHQAVDKLDAYQLRPYYYLMDNAYGQYSYEYHGFAGRLIVSPAITRYRTAFFEAMQYLFRGYSLIGASGTGKTETVKDFSRALGRFCLVFNCSEAVDHGAFLRVFMGLASVGALLCLDEFNRLAVSTLSVVSRFITQIQQAMARKAIYVNLMSESLDGGHEAPEDTKDKKLQHGTKLRPTASIFITMNESSRAYSDRLELPGSTTCLFRPLLITRPDISHIVMGILLTCGFTTAVDLGRKYCVLFSHLPSVVTLPPPIDESHLRPSMLDVLSNNKAVLRALTAERETALIASNLPEEQQSPVMLSLDCSLRTIKAVALAAAYMFRRWLYIFGSNETIRALLHADKSNTKLYKDHLSFMSYIEAICNVDSLIRLMSPSLTEQDRSNFIHFLANTFGHDVVICYLSRLDGGLGVSHDVHNEVPKAITRTVFSLLSTDPKYAASTVGRPEVYEPLMSEDATLDSRTSEAVDEFASLTTGQRSVLNLLLTTDMLYPTVQTLISETRGQCSTDVLGYASDLTTISENRASTTLNRHTTSIMGAKLNVNKKQVSILAQAQTLVTLNIQRRLDVVHEMYRTACRVSHLLAYKYQGDKFIELENLLWIRHGIILLGQQHSFKTTLWRLLMNENNNVTVVNPQALAADGLFGGFVEGEFHDGVFGATLRTYCIESYNAAQERRRLASEMATQHRGRRASTTEAGLGASFSDGDAANNDEGRRSTDDLRFIVLDGPLEAATAECLNSLLDDNRILCLPNGERIRMTAYLRILFEVTSLATASPSTLSRCGVICIEESVQNYELQYQSILLRGLREIFASDYDLFRTTYLYNGEKIQKYAQVGVAINNLDLLFDRATERLRTEGEEAPLHPSLLLGENLFPEDISKLSRKERIAAYRARDKARMAAREARLDEFVREKLPFENNLYANVLDVLVTLLNELFTLSMDRLPSNAPVKIDLHFLYYNIGRLAAQTLRLFRAQLNASTEHVRRLVRLDRSNGILVRLLQGYAIFSVVWACIGLFGRELYVQQIDGIIRATVATRHYWDLALQALTVPVRGEFPYSLDQCYFDPLRLLPVRFVSNSRFEQLVGYNHVFQALSHSQDCNLDAGIFNVSFDTASSRIFVETLGMRRNLFVALLDALYYDRTITLEKIVYPPDDSDDSELPEGLDRHLIQVDGFGMRIFVERLVTYLQMYAPALPIPLYFSGAEKTLSDYREYFYNCFRHEGHALTPSNTFGATNLFILSHMDAARPCCNSGGAFISYPINELLVYLQEHGGVYLGPGEPKFYKVSGYRIINCGRALYALGGSFDSILLHCERTEGLEPLIMAVFQAWSQEETIVQGTNPVLFGLLPAFASVITDFLQFCHEVPRHRLTFEHTKLFGFLGRFCTITPETFVGVVPSVKAGLDQANIGVMRRSFLQAFLHIFRTEFYQQLPDSQILELNQKLDELLVRHVSSLISELKPLTSVKIPARLRPDVFTDESTFYLNDIAPKTHMEEQVGLQGSPLVEFTFGTGNLAAYDLNNVQYSQLAPTRARTRQDQRVAQLLPAFESSPLTTLHSTLVISPLGDKFSEFLLPTDPLPETRPHVVLNPIFSEHLNSLQYELKKRVLRMAYCIAKPDSHLLVVYQPGIFIEQTARVAAEALGYTVISISEAESVQRLVYGNSAYVGSGRYCLILQPEAIRASLPLIEQMLLNSRYMAVNGYNLILLVEPTMLSRLQKNYPHVLKRCFIDVPHTWPIAEIALSASKLLSSELVRVFCATSDGVIPLSRLDVFTLSGTLLMRFATIFEGICDLYRRRLGCEHLIKSPVVFARFLRVYYKLYSTRKAELSEQERRLRKGLELFELSSTQAKELSEQLTVLKPQLERQQQKVKLLLAELTEKQELAQENHRSVSGERAELMIAYKHIEAEIEDAHKEVNRVLPALKRADDALQNLNRQDIAELSTFTNPHPLVVLVMNALCILLDNPPTWASARALLSSGTLITTLLNYNKKEIPPRILTRFRAITGNPDFNPQKILSISAAATTICSWCIAVVDYATVWDTVLPKIERLNKAKEDHEEHRKHIEEKEAELAALQSTLERLKEDLETNTHAREELRTQIVDVETRYEFVEKIRTLLESERGSWDASLTETLKTSENLATNMLETTKFMFVSLLGSSIGRSDEIDRSVTRASASTTYAYSTEESTSNTLVFLDAPSPSGEVVDMARVQLCTNEDVCLWRQHWLPADDSTTNSMGCLVNSVDIPYILDPESVAETFLSRLPNAVCVKYDVTNPKDVLDKVIDCGINGNVCVLISTEVDIPSFVADIMATVKWDPSSLFIGGSDGNENPPEANTWKSGMTQLGLFENGSDRQKTTTYIPGSTVLPPSARAELARGRQVGFPRSRAASFSFQVDGDQNAVDSSIVVKIHGYEYLFSRTFNLLLLNNSCSLISQLTSEIVSRFSLISFAKPRSAIEDHIVSVMVRGINPRIEYSYLNAVTEASVFKFALKRLEISVLGTLMEQSADSLLSETLLESLRVASVHKEIIRRRLNFVNEIHARILEMRNTHRLVAVMCTSIFLGARQLIPMSLQMYSHVIGRIVISKNDLTINFAGNAEYNNLLNLSLLTATTTRDVSLRSSAALTGSMSFGSLLASGELPLARSRLNEAALAVTGTGMSLARTQKAEDFDSIDIDDLTEEALSGPEASMSILQQDSANQEADIAELEEELQKLAASYVTLESNEFIESVIGILLLSFDEQSSIGFLYHLFSYLDTELVPNPLLWLMIKSLIISGHEYARIVTPVENSVLSLCNGRQGHLYSSGDKDKFQTSLSASFAPQRSGMNADKIAEIDNVQDFSAIQSTFYVVEKLYPQNTSQLEQATITLDMRQAFTGTAETMAQATASTILQRRTHIANIVSGLFCTTTTQEETEFKRIKRRFGDVVDTAPVRYALTVTGEVESDIIFVNPRYESYASQLQDNIVGSIINHWPLWQRCMCSLSAEKTLATLKNIIPTLHLSDIFGSEHARYGDHLMVLLVRHLNPAHLRIVLNYYVLNSLKRYGVRSSAVQKLGFGNILNVSDSQLPIVISHSASVDAVRFVTQFLPEASYQLWATGAPTRDLTHRTRQPANGVEPPLIQLRTIVMSKGVEKTVLDLITQTINTPTWIVLQNAHLTPEFVSNDLRKHYLSLTSRVYRLGGVHLEAPQGQSDPGAGLVTPLSESRALFQSLRDGAQRAQLNDVQHVSSYFKLIIATEGSISPLSAFARDCIVYRRSDSISFPTVYRKTLEIAERYFSNFSVTHDFAITEYKKEHLRTIPGVTDVETLLSKIAYSVAAYALRTSFGTHGWTAVHESFNQGDLEAVLVSLSRIFSHELVFHDDALLVYSAIVNTMSRHYGARLATSLDRRTLLHLTEYVFGCSLSTIREYTRMYPRAALTIEKARELVSNSILDIDIVSIHDNPQYIGLAEVERTYLYRAESNQVLEFLDRSLGTGILFSVARSIAYNVRLENYTRLHLASSLPHEVLMNFSSTELSCPLMLFMYQEVKYLNRIIRDLTSYIRYDRYGVLPEYIVEFMSLRRFDNLHKLINHLTRARMYYNDCMIDKNYMNIEVTLAFRPAALFTTLLAQACYVAGGTIDQYTLAYDIVPYSNSRQRANVQLTGLILKAAAVDPCSGRVTGQIAELYNPLPVVRVLARRTYKKKTVIISLGNFSSVIYGSERRRSRSALPTSSPDKGSDGDDPSQGFDTLVRAIQKGEKITSVSNTPKFRPRSARLSIPSPSLTPQNPGPATPRALTRRNSLAVTSLNMSRLATAATQGSIPNASASHSRFSARQGMKSLTLDVTSLRSSRTTSADNSRIEGDARASSVGSSLTDSSSDPDFVEARAANVVEANVVQKYDAVRAKNIFDRRLTYFSKKGFSGYYEASSNVFECPIYTNIQSKAHGPLAYAYLPSVEPTESILMRDVFIVLYED
ncbi:Ciliary dynein heavy chain 11 [Giardia muris]|uniref:Ciliary dynein heavy chain 11 n=1 Tax=Giardia muris TaxID=5742 RepID=A0A4Z1T6Z0_GIAMU|nr:Ciliary dynein heavy chain 11 [Giardia muris]|eukprot:TNJ28261.1 Ciliary dynein heavy chain 11 [Giardia muris]